MNTPQSEKKDGNGQIAIVGIVANECHLGGTAESGFVQQPANKPVTESDKWHSLNPAFVALPIGKRNKAVACAYCGVSFVPKRAWGRFCNGRCRIAAYRAQQVVMG